MTNKDKLMKIKCEKCNQVFYLDKKIWSFHKNEKAFCKFCGVEGFMKDIFKVVFTKEDLK